MRPPVATCGDYSHGMSPPPAAVRLQHWSDFVRRALAHAHITQGWSVPRIAKEAGIGSNTIYRWRDARGIKAPSPEQVVAFCDALGLPAAQAHRILWPGQHDTPAPAAPEPALPEDLVAIARKLHDPALPGPERYYLQETLHQLAARPSRPEASRPLPRRKRRSQGQG